MDFEVGELRDGEVLVILPLGRLDSGNAHVFESVVRKHLGNGEQRIVVDCSDLDFIASSGLRVLLISSKELKASDGTLMLCGLSDDIRKVLRISGVDRLLPITASRAEALKATG